MQHQYVVSFISQDNIIAFREKRLRAGRYAFLRELVSEDEHT